MFLSTASTKRPIAMSCLLIALTILGLNAYRSISLENMPSVDIPYVTVTTVWAGASAEDIMKDVAKPIEDAVAGVEGLKHVNSLCLDNACSTVMEFDLSVNVDVAAQDVREKIDEVISDLPAGADKPVVKKYDLNAASVASMFLRGDQTPDDLYEYADNKLSDRFSNVKGVAEVQIIGGSEREIWVELDRDKLAAAGLTSYDVVAAIKNGVLSIPGGRLKDSGSEYTIQFDADMDSVGEISSMEVAAKDGRRRYLSDLGTVRKASEEVRQKAFLNGEQGVIFKIVKKSDGNTVEVVNSLRRRFEEVKRELPAGMELVWVMDDGMIVQKTVDSTTNDIVSAVLLCAGILFVFLLNERTTLIVSVTMPATIIISLFFMKLCGQTLNIATMLAIGLSAGILVSNSIVVLENVVRRFEDVPSKWEAARIGASQVAVAVLASAGTNVIVMLPIAMMTSLVGQFFKPFAVTTLIVNIASIFISFTLIPILCALFMRRASEKSSTWFARLGRKWDERFEGWAAGYGSLLRRVADSRVLSGAIILATVALFLLTITVGRRGLGFIFTENDDWGRAFIRVEFPSYYNLDRTEERTREIAGIFDGYPDLMYSMVSVGKADAVGGQANEGVYLAQIELVFKSVYERGWKMMDVIQRIRKDTADVPDAIISTSIPSMLGGSQNNLEVEVRGPDIDVAAEIANVVKLEMMKNPGVAAIDVTSRDDKPEIKVTPKRAVLADAGITPAALGTIVRANIDGVEAASFKAGAKTVDIRVKYAERAGVDQVGEFPVPVAGGYTVPLNALADVAHDRTKLMIYRVDKDNIVKFVGNETPGYATGTLLAEIERIGNEEIRRRGLAGYSIFKSGMSEKMGESIADFGHAIVLAVVLTYLTLAAILESFSRPFVVLLTLPLALIGVILALQIAGMNISIFVLLGIILLIGVVVNAAVLIVDKMDQLQRGGMERRESMFEAVRQTFRSVVMVIAASGLGMIPIAMATGIGAVNRIGIGAASVGGIIIAGVLTMTFIPLLYVFCCKRPPDSPSGGAPEPVK